MFDISWTEFLLIGIVALVVIGPKELPGVMRTLGQWTRKVRGMAADFQNQFHEAMREAEMADLKKQVDDMAQDFKNIDPLKGVRDDVESAGRDIHQSLSSAPEDKPALPAAVEAAGTDAPADEAAVAAEPPAPPALESAAPVGAVERSELEAVGAETKPAEPEAAPAESTGRSA